MTCIGGTPDAPNVWVLFRGGKEQKIDGRWCDRVQPYTNRRRCSACPAYRGIRWDGTVATGMAPNGDLVALGVDEYAEYQSATEASFDGDDGPWHLFMARLEEGMGARALREIGDPDAQDRWSGYMRSYRARMSDDQKERQRATTRDRVRRFRARNVSTPRRS